MKIPTLEEYRSRITVLDAQISDMDNYIQAYKSERTECIKQAKKIIANNFFAELKPKIAWDAVISRNDKRFPEHLGLSNELRLVDVCVKCTSDQLHTVTSDQCYLVFDQLTIDGKKNHKRDQVLIPIKNFC